MFSLLPLLSILIAVAIFIFLFTKKWPQLTLLDVDSLPEVQEAKKKDEYLKRRAEKKFSPKDNPAIQKTTAFASSMFSSMQGKFRDYTTTVADKMRASEEETDQAEDLSSTAVDHNESSQEHDSKIATIIERGQKALDQESLSVAESTFIAAIKVDEKSVDAYKGLAEVYIRREQWQEAAQTLKFACKLDGENDTIVAKLAGIYESLGDIDKAIQWYEKAILINPHVAGRYAKLAELLERAGHTQAALQAIKESTDIEQQNPKYLDKLLELAIIVRNKPQAEKAYQQLRMVNPDNKKLASFKERISDL